MHTAFRFEKTKERIGILTFDLPNSRVNKFSTPVMQELNDSLAELAKMKDLKCLIIRSAKPGFFIVGADIKEIEAIHEVQQGFDVSRNGQLVFDKVTKLPYPSVAVIDGTCMGGGTEFSLACTYRLATDNPKTKIALPEVNLGIFPGWGGTQRLPRLIGLQRSLGIILTGKSLDGKKAYRTGLVDKLIPKELVDEAALEFAHAVIRGENVLLKSKRKQKGLLPYLLEKNFIGRSIVYRIAHKSILKNTKGHYPAPIEALKSVRKGFCKSLEKGLLIEAKLFSKLIGTPISNNLINIFNWTEEVKKMNGTPNPEIKPLEIKKIATLGAGIMGGGIAQLFASRGIPVRVKDINYDAVAKAYEQASRVLNSKLKRRRINQLEYSHILSHITATIDYSGFRNIDFVVEAIIEDIEIKKKVFKELEENINENTIVVSNTSSLLIEDMAAVFQNPARFVGMHFFNPVHKMPLVEVVRGKNSSEEAIATTFGLAKKLGKTPVVVNDGPGFLVNRLLVPYMVEAVSLLEEGYSVVNIDKTMIQFGMPMGPIELFDEVGIDVAYKVAKILSKSMGSRMAESNVLEKMVNANKFGKKNNNGFYIYEGRKKRVDPKIGKYIQIQNPSDLTKEELIKRMVYPMVNEAARCLKDNIVKRPQDVDLAMIFGTGFAPFRGGLLNYADSEGIDEVVRHLDKFTESIGSRFKPCDMLIKIQKSSKNFYTFFDQN